MYKIHNLYLPFVIWNLLFLVITVIFEDYTIGLFFKKTILIIFTLDKVGLFLGATWFISALFLITVLYKIVESSFKESDYKDIVLLFIFSILAIIGYKFNFPYALSRVLILGFFYAVGAFIKKHKQTISNKISDKFTYYLFPILGGIIFIFIAYFNVVDLGINVEIKYPLLFVVGALCASYFIIYLSKWMENSGNKIVSVVKKLFIVSGQHSIDILIWHFVFFKIVIIVQMIMNNEKITYSNIMHHYPIFSSFNGWWIIYLLVGIFFTFNLGLYSTKRSFGSNAKENTCYKLVYLT